MYFSMGSLWTSAIGVTPKAASLETMKWTKQGDLKRLCSPRLAVCHYWGAQLIGEVPILGYVIERFRLIIRILSMIIQGCTWRMYQMLWWKCTPSAECKTIRIAASAVMDGWDGHTVPLSDVVYYNWWLERWSWLDSQQSCGNDTNVPTWVIIAE